MDLSEIAHHRLHSQRISREKFARPSQVVSWFGAMQAQDYTSVKWGVGLRCRSATGTMVDGAVASKNLLRTWMMRGTLHIAAASDVRWMLALLAPRLIANSARRNRQLELDEGTFARSFDTLTGALQGEKPLTRAEIMGTLESGGISAAGQRGYHILRRAGLEGLICFGPTQDDQETFVLLDEWAPRSADANPADGLAELAGRYFRSHGPATLGDFVWWSGLKAAEARAGLEAAKSRLNRETIDGEIYWSADDQPIPTNPSPAVHLLPAYDEYYLGYRDRSVVLDPKVDAKAIASGGVFRPMIVLDGQIAGTWKRDRRWFAPRRAQFLKRFGHRLDDLARALLDQIESVPAVVNQRLGEAPSTLLHGDLHLDNIVFEGDTEPVILDWAGCARGPLALDLHNLLFNICQIQDVEPVLAGYLNAFAARAAKPLGPGAVRRHLAGAFLYHFAIATCGVARWQPGSAREAAMIEIGIQRALRALSYWQRRDPALLAFLQ